MHRIDGPGATPDNRFTEGDPVAAVPATEVSATWLNSVQEELVAIVLEAGLSLDKGDDSQVLQAILSLIGNAVESVAIVSGTKMLFLNSSAPTGWTQDTTINDRVIRVVSSAGGGVGGSWTLSGLSASVGNTTLSLSQTPSHTHPISRASDRGTFAQWDSGGGRVIDGGTLTAYNRNTANTNAVGGSGAHAHSASISSDGTWRPAYVNVIACTKD